MLWLRDLLPNEIQDARIFTYGYDSMPAQVAGRASTKFIHQHAESFLQDLHAHRVSPLLWLLWDKIGNTN